MNISFRKRRSLHVPVALNVILVGVNVALMVCWIVLLVHLDRYGAMSIGTAAFGVTLMGLVYYLLLTVKSWRLTRRQANFIDSVTHELKSPIASLRLYLETLETRPLDDERRGEFYSVMDQDLMRLDRLISQLLEVARLDSLATPEESEEIQLAPLLHDCAEQAARLCDVDYDETFRIDASPAVVRASRLALEMVFRNLMENAVKYGGEPPRVDVEARQRNGKTVVSITDNGEGIPREDRRKVFRLFFRRGDELTRRRPGTGLGLYIVSTLAHKLGGKVRLFSRRDGPGCLFEVTLPAA